MAMNTKNKLFEEKETILVSEGLKKENINVDETFFGYTFNKGLKDNHNKESLDNKTKTMLKLLSDKARKKTVEEYCGIEFSDSDVDGNKFLLARRIDSIRTYKEGKKIIIKACFDINTVGLQELYQIVNKFTEGNLFIINMFEKGYQLWKENDEGVSTQYSDWDLIDFNLSFSQNKLEITLMKK